MPHSTRTATKIRTLVNASGANTPVANFTTMKLRPQIRAMHKSRISVTDRPDPAPGARSGDVVTYIEEAIP